MLKQLRLKTGLTQKELSEKLNVKQNTISMWESGKAQPPLNKIYALASALNVSAGEIVKCILDNTDNETILWFIVNQESKR